MKIIQYGTHVFTSRPELTIQSLLRDAKERQSNRERYSTVYPHSVIIKYPWAVSWFSDGFWYDYSYAAASYSSRRRAPVLLCITGRRPKTPKDEIQIFKTFWGIEKKCVANIELYSEGGAITSKSEGLDDLRIKFGHLLPKDSILYQVNDTILPLDFAAAFGKELNIDLGPDLAELLKHCTKTKEYTFDVFYEANCQDMGQQDKDTGTVLLS